MRSTLRHALLRPTSPWPALQRPVLHRAFAATANDCYYKALGVKADASSQQIKQAYRKLALQCHPDRSDAPDAEDKFKRVSQAYSVLSDDAQRAQYDAQRRFGSGTAGASGGAGPFSGPFTGPFGGAQPFSHADAERMFRELERELGRQMATAQRMQQQPHHGNRQQQEHIRRQQQEFVRQMGEQMRRQGSNQHQQRVVINMAQMTPEEQEKARKMVRTAAKTAAKTIGRAMLTAATDAMARKARSVFDDLNPFSSKKKK